MHAKKKYKYSENTKINYFAKINQIKYKSWSMHLYARDFMHDKSYVIQLIVPFSQRPKRHIVWGEWQVYQCDW